MELVVAGVTRVVVGRGVVTPERVFPEGVPRRVGVLCQPGEPALAARRFAADLEERGVGGAVLEQPDGEAAKTLAVAEEACRDLAALGLTREDAVVGIGGGAMTDLAGFVAAVFFRGVRAGYVPTTLLAAVDAAIGGKTGVNIAGKNLAGVFRHPESVVVDLDVLERLPAPLRRQGAAEALKAGMIGDPALVDLFERQGLEVPLDAVVGRALAVKAAIVGRDPTEVGERAHLNYGHTVGHAIEWLTGLSHGEAVSLGMVVAAAVSERETGFDGKGRQAAILDHLGLPTAAPSLAADEVMDLVGLDKKRAGEAMRMVLLEGVGRPKLAPVAAATVRDSLTEIGIR